MTPEEAAAIRYALRKEINANHLVGFASSLAPEHAVPAGLLWARSRLLERRRSLDPLLLSLAFKDLIEIAEGRVSVPCDPALDALQGDVYALSRPLRRDPRLLFTEVCRIAGQLAVNGGASLSDVPVPMATLARRLVVEIIPGIRFVHPAAARLGPRAPELTSPSQREDRARWVRQYAREAALRP